LVHGPSGVTWCVCTSTTNSPFPASACSHASTLCGGGTMYEPPGREVVEFDGDVEVGDDERLPGGLHAAARSIVARTAATPPAVRRNRRRSIPVARAASSTCANAAACTSRSCRVGGSGMYSPFVADVTPSGKRTSRSGSSSLRRVTRSTIRLEPGSRATTQTILRMGFHDPLE
jgi:hypothetical protein